MSSDSKKAITNVFSIAVGQIINLVLNFIAITIAARSLGVEEFGKFGYMLAVAVVLSKVIDLGLVPIVFRELSKSKEKYNLLNTAISLRVVIFIVLAFSFNLFLFLSQNSINEIVLFNILLVGSIISAKFVCVRELLDLPFKVNYKMHIPMLFTNFDNFILMLGIPFLPFVDNKLTYFVILYTASNIPGFLLTLFFLHKKYNFRLTILFEKSKWLLKQSFPIYAAIILDSIFQQMDVIMLKWFSSYYDAGIYSIAFRLVAPILVFPTAVITTLFPTFSNGKDNPTKFNTLISFSLKLFYLFSVILTIVFYFKNSIVITLLFGNEFKNSGLTASILLLSNVFVFYNFFITNLMIAWDKQILNFYYSFIVLLLHAVFSILLIPLFFYNGVAISRLIVGLIGYGITTFYLFKTNSSFFLIEKNILLFSILCVLFAYLASFLPLIIYLIICIPAIIFAIIITKFFNREEILFFFRTIKKEELGNKIILKLKI